VAALTFLVLLYVGCLVSFRNSASTLGVLSVALACVAVGALLGFIFAIPKRTEVALINSGAEQGNSGEAPTTTARASISGTAYRPNTSLEEISDWLTKIIVGLGLVQAQAIGRFVQDQGAAVAPTLYGPGAAPILGSATLVAISVLTFLTSFLYFRLYLAEEFTRSDNDARRAQNEARDDYRKAREEGRTQGSRPREALSAIVSSPAVTLSSQDTQDDAASPPVRDTRSDEVPTTLQAVVERKLAEMRESPPHPDDPAKGVFGGKASVQSPGTRDLTATVRPVRGDSHNFKIDLVLTSGDPKLRGEVVFFYHPTFEVSHERVRVAGGEARIRLYAYGAFTVGVLADDGRTELELDLSELPDAPADFLDN
jgi:hypothetical protein